MNPLADLVAAAHRRYAAHPAVLAGGGPAGAGTTGAGTADFAELGARARAAAGALARLGLRPGDRVLIALDNRAETLPLEHGIWLGGLVRVAVGTRLHPEEIGAIAADCAPGALVCESRIAGALAGLPAGCRVITPDAGLGALFTGPPGGPGEGPADGLAALMYTSGSTGRPKGARVTGAAWAAMLEAMWAALPPIGPGDVVLHTAPMSHFGGSVGSAYTLAGAAALPLARFDAGAVLEAAERHAVTAMPMVPTMLERLTAAAVERGARPAALRAIVYGAAPISVPALLRARDAFGDVLHQFYGLSEALAPLTVLAPGDHASGDAARLASAGRPVASVRLSVLDGDGAPLPAGETGELAVSGPQIMPGYWNDEAASAAALTGGVFRTGDLGFVDAGGYLHLAGRRSEVIVTGGYTVHPGEVERAIAALDGVAEVAVLGVPDATWGETVAAAVVPRPGAAVTEDDVLRACAARLAGYKKPRRIVFADELPQNSTGKVARRLLRAWF
ncbi:class I adenylate-forming enzyme family protein [Actinomadura xylanilytica]|uniref:class I adenylate-forming enzyme family protein n=1 Tax=Actinomadura xylanilytica TaxID=887459 RepID=UPI00255A9EFD|nr:AMP-binding protein [Actinomadura xylanilytica]MDL4776521.1 AMP-binding protein [Actinomadura xylanilytica]